MFLAVLFLTGVTFLVEADGQTILTSAPPIYVHLSDIELIVGIVGLILFSVGRFRGQTVRSQDRSS